MVIENFYPLTLEIIILLLAYRDSHGQANIVLVLVCWRFKQHRLVNAFYSEVEWGLFSVQRALAGLKIL